MNLLGKIKFKQIASVIVGALLGYAYYFFIGCHNGCPIQSNPLASTFYGALLGALLSIPSQSKKGEQKN